MASTAVVSLATGIAIVFTLVGLASFVRGTVALWQTTRDGKPDHTRTDQGWRRFGAALWDIVSHQTFRGRPVVRIAHWLVMVSFIALILTLLRSYAQIGNPAAELPIIGGWALANWIAEFFAWTGFLGIIALMIIRALAKPTERTSRFYGSTRWQAYFVEWVILLVCLCVLLLHGMDYAYSYLAGQTDYANLWHFPLTAWFGAWFTNLSPTALANLIVITSAIKIAVSMSWMVLVGVQISMGVAWHRFLAPINLFARREAGKRKSLGKLALPLVAGEPQVDFDELPDDAVLGLGETADFTWKDRLDFYTCTECGRCQDVCPAWNTGKPLSPKLLTLAMRDNVQSATHGGNDSTEIESVEDLHADSFDIRSALAKSGITGPEGVPKAASSLVPDVIGGEALWDCTMCGACVEQCPVDIDHVDRIANLRRFQVLMESSFPKELARPFKGMETKANPYSQPPRKRLDWAKNLPFDVPVIGEDIEDAREVDYLFWVGCAGAYDDRAKKTTAAVAELLHTAGVSFAVLGAGESCTGDPARRAGNEVLFQMLAGAAIETLQEAKAKRLVVTCAHCFNTIANEFPDLDGHFDVIHHTQLLNRLVREGRLTPVAPTEGVGEVITYHDPCFLGRHNQVFTPPRELLGSLPLELREMPRNRENAFCCGAGGARAWMEETRGTRIAGARMDEASATGATTVATACPFCTQMLDGAGDDVQVKDVAILMLESVQRGQAENHPHQ